MTDRLFHLGRNEWSIRLSNDTARSILPRRVTPRYLNVDEEKVVYDFIAAAERSAWMSQPPEQWPREGFLVTTDQDGVAFTYLSG